MLDSSTEDFSRVEEAVVYLTNFLEWFAEQFILKASEVVTRRPVPWWPDDCRRAIVERHQAFE